MRIFLHELAGKSSSPSIGRQLQDDETLRSYGIVPEVAFDVVTHQKGTSPADVIAVIMLGEFGLGFVRCRSLHRSSATFSRSRAHRLQTSLENRTTERSRCRWQPDKWHTVPSHSTVPT